MAGLAGYGQLPVTYRLNLRLGNEDKMSAKAAKTRTKVHAVIKAEGGDILGASRRFLCKLLVEGIVDYLLVPEEISGGRSLALSLIKNLEKLDKANPFSPVMPISGAMMVAQLTSDKSEKKLGAVLKPCEIRALVELVKLEQANLDNVTIIGTDCLGTYEVEDYTRVFNEVKGSAEEKATQVLGEMCRNITKPGSMPAELRSSCKMCNSFTPALADITIGVFGEGDEIYVNIDDGLAEKLGLELQETPGRQETVDKLLAKRNEVREQVFSGFREKMKSIIDFADTVDTCIRCYACQAACPLCYCRVCFFHTDTFEPESERYYRWADREGAVRMPTEILLYQLTRLSHVALSCCGCGMCESACPRGLPLTAIFQTVGDGLQKALNYVPGRSLEEKIPVTTFSEIEV